MYIDYGVCSTLFGSPQSRVTTRTSMFMTSHMPRVSHAIATDQKVIKRPKLTKISVIDCMIF